MTDAVADLNSDAASAHPTNMACGDTDNEGKRFDILRDHGPRADK